MGNTDPSQATVRPGEDAAIVVCIVNHLRASALAQTQLRLPEGWTSQATGDDRAIGPGEQGALRFTLQAPATAPRGEHHIIAAAIMLREWRSWPVAEGLVHVVPPEDP